MPWNQSVLSGAIQTASSPRPIRSARPSNDELEQRGLGRRPVGRVVATGEQRGDLLGREPVGIRGQELGRVVRRSPPFQGRIEVRDQDVVRRDRLEPAGHQASPSRANVTDEAVNRTEPSVEAVLPWSSAALPAALRASARSRS